MTASTAAVILAIVVTDQLSKMAAAGSAGWLRREENPGLALGLLDGPAPIEITAAAVAIGVAARLLLGRGQGGGVAAGLLLGGALANLLDRLQAGAVRDIIAVPLVTLNLADLALVVGLGWLAVSRWHRSRSGPPAPPPRPGSPRRPATMR